MKKNTPWFDLLERRVIVDLGGVATGDGVQLVLKRWVMGKKPLWVTFSEKLKMLFLKNTYKPCIFDKKIFLTGRWQYL